jgi:hypothetical protein
LNYKRGERWSSEKAGRNPPNDTLRITGEERECWIGDNDKTFWNSALESDAIQMQFIAPSIFQTSSSEFIVITVKSSSGLLVEVAKLQIGILQVCFLHCNDEPVFVKMPGRSVTPAVYIIHEVLFKERD